MQIITRMLTIAAITVVSAGSGPAIAAAAPSAGSGSGTGSQKAICSLLKAAVNIQQEAGDKMDKGSAAATVLNAGASAANNLGESICGGVY
jgi:hypothetical protein